MANTERTSKVDHPTEPTDHPHTTTAERLGTYESNIAQHRRDNWSTADPIKRLTTEQRDKAYPPTDKPDSPPKPAEHSPETPAPPTSRDTTEPETVRRIRVEHGDRDAGPEEPAGEELLGTSDKGSRLERINREVVETADDWNETASRFGGTLGELIAQRKPPTAHEQIQPQHLATMDQPRHAVDGDNIGSALFAVLVVAGAAYDKLHRALNGRRDNDSASN